MDTEPRADLPPIQRLEIPKRTPRFEAYLINVEGRLRNARNRKLAQAKDKLRRDLLTGKTTPAVRLMERQIESSKPLLVRY